MTENYEGAVYGISGHDRYKLYSCKSCGLLKLFSDRFRHAAKIQYFRQNGI